MLRLVVLLFLCIAATYTPGHCEARASRNVERARLPEFLSELDLSSLEASEEDVEALKKIVKRLAPEKNGEYQVYQVFFGNEDLLKEWLKGAGVTGQPGVDYPALTSIPATSFSCRGLRGGYYADLETNCQVFHICDNGRKISFLCPNGTIFQQSQLICDWWFKVDCSRSTELYEQSAEQLAEEERKRADARKMKSEYHRGSEQDNANYYDAQSVDYDGRQNGRTNPYGQTVPNQISERQEEPKSVQHYGPNNVYDNTGRYYPESAPRGHERTTQTTPENLNQPKQRTQYHTDGGSAYQPNNRQRNQLVDAQSGKFGYGEHGNKYAQDARQNYQTALNDAQQQTTHYRPPSQSTPRNNDRPEFRNPKSRTSPRNNLLGASQPQKATPTYMETTTFRTTTAAPPPREFQQFAESAAFVSNRGNRLGNGKPLEGGSRQFYYPSYEHREYTTAVDETTIAPQTADRVSFTPKTGAPPYPGPTFAPIYKPRTTTLPPYETTLQYTPTTETPYYSTSFYRQEETTPVDRVTATATSSTAEDYQSTTESYVTYYDQQRATAASIGKIPPAVNYQSQYADVRVTGRDTDRDTASFATARPYVNTESYRHHHTATDNATSSAGRDAYPTTTTTASVVEDAARGATRGDHQSDAIKGTTRDPAYASSSPSLRQNSISSTEKPWRSTNVYQQSGSTSKTLSPYDTSFTYKQGKVLSTLGPYVPFTKNYVYSTMTGTTITTPRPAITASTHGPNLTNYRITASNLIPKVKSSPAVATGKPKDRATYLPETSSKRPTTTTTILENRPYAEREHALGMLHSLQGLENNANGLSEVGGRAGSGRNVPLAPGPSTLHSLALYFATASDNFDSNETAESTGASAEREVEGDSANPHGDGQRSVELPASILTRHTITSYTELFNLNNALEGNTTMTELAAEADAGEENVGEDGDDDLEIEQSEGPLNGAKRSNGTKLRELAQVFTHALSAYLHDPDTFKRVLTEIRPTEPSATTTDGGQFEATTLYPITTEEYSSVTKEKDEVLDFSDDADASRRRKPPIATTAAAFPTTLQPPTVTPATTDRPYSTHRTTPYEEYYSTTMSETPRPVYYPSTTLLPPAAASDDSSTDYVESSTQVTGGNTFAFEVNHAFGTTAANRIRGFDGDTRDTTDLSLVYDNYFPSDEDGNRNRIGGFHNNTSRDFQPYGKNVKPIGATPVSNYVTSSTAAASFQHDVGTTSPSWGKGSAGDRPVQDLTPPHYQRFGNVRSFEVSNSIVPSQATRSTTPLTPRSESTYEAASSTVQPFRIHYYGPSTSSEERKSSPESLVTARTSYVKFRNNYNRIEGTRKPAENAAATVTTTKTTAWDTVGTLQPVTATANDIGVTPYTATIARATSSESDDDASSGERSGTLSDDHWTSSPAVTQLWETTVFVDPRRINHGLESNDDAVRLPTTDHIESEFTASTARPSTVFTGDLDGTTETRTTTSTPSPWQWAPNDNDSPVAFTLLPTTLAAENTATPTPIVTTRSSISTTITTSSVTTSSDPASRDNLSSTLLPLAVTANAWNTTENEVIKAQEMFGKLNETSSETLMRVMKQADSNETVRQLVLLLISHCNGPRNKTMEQEREQLLDALLRLPVNEFDSNESREIIAGISKLHLTIGKTRAAAPSNSSSTTKAPRALSVVRPTSSQPSITTFRSRTGRRFRTTTESANSFSRRSDDVASSVADASNSLSEDETTASDGRALELLRSLYTIAARWG